MNSLSSETKEKILKAYWENHENICNNENNDEATDYERGHDDGFEEAIEFITELFGFKID